MIRKSIGFLFFVLLLCLLIPSTAFAQVWEPEQRAPEPKEEEQTEAPTQQQEPYGGWEVQEEEVAEKSANIPLMVLAQSGGILGSYILLGTAAVALLFTAFIMNNEALIFAAVIPALAIPIAWPLVTNQIGKWMHGGSHLGWSFAGAALGLVGSFGFGAISAYFDGQQFSGNETALSFPAALTFRLLAAASPFVGTIGGYHYGRLRVANESSNASIGLSPIIGPERGVGAGLSLSLSF